MNYSDFVAEVKKIGLPSVYHHWPAGGAPNLPYIIHLRTGRDDISADNINYHKQQNAAIELYSRYPDFENEEKIESMLERLGFYYETDEPTFIEETDMYLKRYDFTLRKEK